MSQLDFDTVKSNWETYAKLCIKSSKHGMPDLLDAVGERLITTPYGTHEKDGGCYAGGLVEYALKTTTKMRTLASTFNLNVETYTIQKLGDGIDNSGIEMAIKFMKKNYN